MKRVEQLYQRESLRKSVDDKKICKQETPERKQKEKRNSCPLSYIEVIAYAILSSPGKRSTLSEIYAFIQDNFPEFTENRVRWKNTVRHNLSLHECFQRGEVALDRTGCYWRIHPNYVADFSRGDFSRRKARQIPTFTFSQDGGYTSREHSVPVPSSGFPWQMCQPSSSAYVPHVGMLQFHRRSLHVPSYGQHPYLPWDH